MRKIAIALLLALAARPAGALQAGIDVLEAQGFAPLAGKRVGLITNHTGVDASGRTTIDALFAAKNLQLVALFSPEHGIRGDKNGGAPIGDAKDPVTALPIYSLYGATKRPTDAMLKGLDALVFDIQDVGARFYTYLSTMGMAIEEADKRRIAFVVLDRPNPIGGETLEGPVLDGPFTFTGYFPVPVRHGMTPGEMARLHAAAKGLTLALTVVPLQGWSRATLYDQTGYAWINPSPNIRSLDAALLYPGIGLFEATNMSVGRGTDAPFLWFGAPWLDARSLVQVLDAARLPGVHFEVEDKTPAQDLYAGKLCRGVRIEVLDRRSVRAVDIFVHAVCALRDQKVADFHLIAAQAKTMTGSDLYGAVFGSKDSAAGILSRFEGSWRGFAAARTPFLLY
ncbi:MAG: DUF1343 domain-containing protein [Elusimicrobia bacterium]|nr:DUF1343 domain-containing protein [Elusimicrobiota bacterium]